jgi:tyrosine-protein phosphatase 2/3
MTSPRVAHSVGQPFPPASKMSPVVAADVRTPSPNYFGLAVEPSEDRDSAQAPHNNWSPPTSSVKSFAAAIPKQMPLDANPEFEAFRRQADANRGKGFHLGSSHFAMQPPPLTSRPHPPRRQTNQNDNPFEAALARPSLNKTGSSRMDIDTDSLHDSAYVSSDSKRNSEASLNAPIFSDIPKHESPVQSDSSFQPIRRSNLSKVEEAHPRLSLPQNKADPPSPNGVKPRSETLPPTLEGSPGLITPGQLEAILKYKSESDYLLLDVRVATHYAQSRIKNALNLCIPTTLLKRATFDLQKLQKTLQTEEDQEKFSQWRDVKYLIVYDVASAEKRDAHSAMNMLKKFSNEGYTGNSYLLRGGFEAFSASYPPLIDRRSAAERAGNVVNGGDGRPTFAPVIGGVMLPSGSGNPNPFFGNIRQNMDLADGVGQMDIAVPSRLDSTMLPDWLRKASAKVDHGHAVSQKFLEIERNEQTRMKDAYTAFNPATSRKANASRVTLSGIEKGGKNRYKDILPFEHARVRLADRPEGDCDYINASHIQAARSNKRYIASQGPLPTTFDVRLIYSPCSRYTDSNLFP